MTLHAHQSHEVVNPVGMLKNLLAHHATLCHIQNYQDLKHEPLT